MNYKERFISVIVDNSISEDWSNAKLEWDHIGSYDQPESNCICGQCITEVCTIQNLQNGVELEVGNVCVKKFLDIDRKSDFKLIKKNTIDWKLLLELKREGVISEWEMYFYEDTRRKRTLSDKQCDIRDGIIKKSKEYVMRKKPRGIPDKDAFKNLIDTQMIIKKEHTKLLGDFLVAQGYKISQGNTDKTFEEVYETLKQIIIQTKRLHKTYEQR